MATWPHHIQHIRESFVCDLSLWCDLIKGHCLDGIIYSEDNS